MPVIQVHDKQHTLKPGQTRIGAGPGVDVAVSTNEALGLQAVLELSSTNQAIIRRARDGAMVRVNGIALGVEPTPLMHGDKVEVGGTEILFSEDKKVGATQFVSAADIAGIAAKRAGPARATGTTGGRLVSLVDGKEYQIPTAGITFGREAGSDVVVAQPEVSRRHATIAPADTGYILQDHSTNGVWVNGTRVQGSQLLSRADVVRVGSEEFRFYADVAPIAPKAPTPAAAPAVMPQAAAPPPAASPAAAQMSAPAPIPASPAPPPAPSPSAPPVAPAPPPAPSAAAAAPPSPPPAPPVAAPAPVEPPRPAPPPAASVPPAPPPVKAEPATAPSAPPKRVEPPTAPAAVRSPAARDKREPTLAAKEEKSGGIPVWVWFALMALVAVGAYFFGKSSG